MDGSRFDTLARLTSQARTRRLALLTALGGLAAAGLATAGQTEARKRKKKKCKKCKSKGLGEPCTTNKQCCTNETNQACSVQNGAGNDDLTCCGATGMGCSSDEDCCQDFQCEGTCQPAPIV